jgi:hypothetical protein
LFSSSIKAFITIWFLWVLYYFPVEIPIVSENSNSIEKWKKAVESLKLEIVTLLENPMLTKELGISRSDSHTDLSFPISFLDRFLSNLEQTD